MIFIIGTGIMGSAIAKALAKAGQKVLVYDKDFAKARKLNGKNIIAQKDFTELSKADFVILAVKPYHIADVAGLVRIKISAVLISIAAGVKIQKLQKFFHHKKIVRMMPNLGLAVGQGIAGWTSSALNNSREKVAVKKLLNSFTENFEVKENQLDAITAISGSGPAYFFYFAEGLEKAALNLGFDKPAARKLVEKTFSAAADLQKGKAYSELISQVASKKGTTEHAIKSFGKSGLHQIIRQAAKSAFKRAQEISNE